MQSQMFIFVGVVGENMSHFAFNSELQFFFVETSKKDYFTYTKAWPQNEESANFYVWLQSGVVHWLGKTNYFFFKYL